MRTFFRLLDAEFLKLRRSAALRALWLLPLLFLILEFMAWGRGMLKSQAVSPAAASVLNAAQLKLVTAIWAGFFHPLLVALFPALLFLPEHRYKVWRHLHTMPVPRRRFFLIKALTLGLLSSSALLLVFAGLWAERSLVMRLNPGLASFPFPAVAALKMLSWLWLGSLPIMALYLWISDRINSLAVPIAFGLVGILLTIALSGQDLSQTWKRDLNPWVLPYVCAQQAVPQPEARQDVHLAASPFQVEKNILRIPSGKKFRTWQNIDDDALFPPSPPTPGWLRASFSLGLAFLLLGVGWFDSGRPRVR